MGGDSGTGRSYKEGEHSDRNESSRNFRNRADLDKHQSNRPSENSRNEKDSIRPASGSRHASIERKRSMQSNRSLHGSPRRAIRRTTYSSKEGLSPKDEGTQRMSHERGIPISNHSIANDKSVRASGRIHRRSRSNRRRSISSFSISSRSLSERSERSPVRTRKRDNHPYRYTQNTRSRQNPSDRIPRSRPPLRRSHYASSVSSFSSSSTSSRRIHRRNIASKGKRNSLITQSKSRLMKYTGRYRARHRERNMSSSDSDDEDANTFSTSHISRRNKISLAGVASIEIGGSGPELVGGAARKLQSVTDPNLLSKEKGEANVDISLGTPKGALASAHVEEKEEELLELGDPRLDKFMEKEVKRFVEAEVQRRLNECIESPAFKLELEKRIEEERQHLLAAMHAEMEIERRKSLDESRRKEAEEKRSKQQLEEILAENERKVREEQRRLAEEQARADEERLLELQKMQQEREEERRNKLVNMKGNSTVWGNQLSTHSASSGRQKLAFKINSSGLGV